MRSNDLFTRILSILSCEESSPYFKGEEIYTEKSSALPKDPHPVNECERQVGILPSLIPKFRLFQPLYDAVLGQRESQETNTVRCDSK